MKKDERRLLGIKVLKKILEKSKVGGISQYQLLKDTNSKRKKKVWKSDFSKTLKPLEESGLIKKELRVLLKKYVKGYKKSHRGDIIHLPKASVDVYQKMVKEYPELITPLLASHYFQNYFKRGVIQRYLRSLKEEHPEFDAENFISSFANQDSDGLYQLKNIIKQSPTALFTFLIADFSTSDEFKSKILGSFLYDLLFSLDDMRIGEVSIRYSGNFLRFLDDGTFNFNGGFDYKQSWK